MRDWINLVERAQFRQPRIMYHGTSSAFLQSILKQGLVPNPQRKYWDTDSQEVQNTFSRVSLYGSYWTSNYMTASSSARNTTKKYLGDELIVIAQIAEQSAYADEDSTDYDLRAALDDTVHALHPQIRSDFTVAIVDDVFGDKRTVTQNIFMMNLHQRMKGHDQHPPNKELADDLLDNLVLRVLAFEVKNGLSFDHWVKTLEKRDIPSITQIDQNLHDLRDRLTRSYRSTALHNGQFNHTLRNPTPVAFKGANRIRWILQVRPWSWEPDESGKSKLIVHPMILVYGDPNLPQDFLEQYRTRMGKFPGLIDRQGHEILPSERTPAE